MPLWLAPVQVMVLNVTDESADYARTVVEACIAQGVRAELDLRNEKIGFKIRQHSIARIPLIVICGQREVDSQTLSVRRHSGVQTSDVLIETLIGEIKASNIKT